ncbi:electron transport complex protein rnfB [Candidatus Ichthyocystis hellenicum]|uniref:Ion-translocating oxidoreductase complex subunit B n=1 Tax=Candidatus Ichthyocystis hellenicum TaxID=1561003 RepID=A0A0S4M3P1_9BURK|nr:electron transport complex subunit RsxB [Candidatus Ichthyocystis hellenicum]CUT16918.1 electron transport complex protein rnfB [Candidatus Ichthyocystis hellenicum]
MTIITSILIMAGLVGVLSALLMLTQLAIKKKDNSLVDEIDDILPQTQCGQCGYPGCRPYAEAIAAGKADINQCPPGGDDGIRKLAELLNKDVKKLNESHGQNKPKSVAVIDEFTCIGCTLCIQACPVDAIVGAAKQNHTVIKEYCTGCELCIAPCPVDCIEMISTEDSLGQWKRKYPIVPIYSRK